MHELFSHTGSQNNSKTGSDGNTRTYQEAGTNTGTQAVAHTGSDTTNSTGTQAVAHTGTVGTSGNIEDIKNHALNPGTTPATNAYTALNYINDQVANKNVASGTTTYNNTDTTTNNLQNQTTHNTTDTTTNNLADAKSGTITDSRQISDSITGQEASNNETTTTMTAGKLKAYEKLLELLDSDVTGDFISKFKICFKQFVMPERTWIYVTELAEDED